MLIVTMINNNYSKCNHYDKWTYGKCYFRQLFYSKYNYGKIIYSKSIMANVTEPYKSISLIFACIIKTVYKEPRGQL